MREELVNRFLKYVKVYTTSDEASETCPSTERQWDLAKILVEDLKEIGLEDISLDKNGYVMATLPANQEGVASIGWIAHMDTAPNYNGNHVNPRMIENYDGKDIVLDAEKKIVSSVADFPELQNYIGKTLIVTDGSSLLGADDKAGVAEILEAMKYLKAHPEIPHGKVRVAFTPDEEIGRGADLFDIEAFDCDFAYTVDGGEIGELEYENFNAASVHIEITGRDIHPGAAKDKMINSILLAMEVQAMLPVEQRPEYTSGYEGFFLLDALEGSVEKTTMDYIIRDHSFEKFTEKKILIQEVLAFLQKKYPKAQFTCQLKDSYFNMKEKIEPVIYIIDLAKKSMKELGIVPKVSPIRGGTDGSRLSYEGLPCPNLFTGGHNFHGKHEYICVESMEKARDLIIKITENVAKM
ncbi:peptidase T [Fusobacterium necrophorum]|uniref:Peptidase T n=1 Tax=Fusobacterium necrophorum TaxID=859 RepID=A0A4V1QXD1_9FUSO|nr:peptidase T [Fusobacterium necrophorum]RXZ69236.1 peptidase T [Fusobacterium necrophorum]